MNFLFKSLVLSSLTFSFAYADSLKDLKAIPHLVFLTPETNQAYLVDLERWQGFRNQERSRWDLFAKLFYANTRARSGSGLQHVGCFLGEAKQVSNLFFDLKNSNNKIAHINSTKFSISPSDDEKLIGISFELLNTSSDQAELDRLTGKKWHFRLPHCEDGGKTSLLSEDLKFVKIDFENIKKIRSIASNEELEESQFTEQGFEIFDKPKIAVHKEKIFRMRSDYDKCVIKSADRPWKGLDLRAPGNAEKFALMLQTYFYEGMATQNLKDPDLNFIPEANPIRNWCHMPWLNVGESGREYVHGMTKERDLAPSDVYRNAPKGSNWGIGFYNSVGCKTIEKVFGTAARPLSKPNFAPASTKYDDGTVTAKILFTTADFPAIKNAFSWKANVSNPGSTVRKLSSVRHIQMDIAVKDSSLKGSSSELDHWVMLSYYYDESYNSPISLPGLPIGLKKMRPQGIQWGFSRAQTSLFANSVTNSFSGALNGPADNPKSNCMSCHATAGTKYGMVPGLLDNKNYSLLKGYHLDFSQQMALAKRNYDTRSR